MKNMTKIFIVVVIFLTFIFVSCGGEEPNNPDEESKTDNEVVDDTLDEISDGVVDNEIDEMSDEDVIETENDIEIDEDVDEIVYTELTNWEECKDSSCSELCHLMWDEEIKERVYWFILARNGEEIDNKDRYLDIWLETSHNLCYVNFEDHTESLSDFQTISERIPISGERETSGNPYYGSMLYFFLFDTGEDFGEKKKYVMKNYTKCINNDEINWCEEKGYQPVYVDGIDGPCHLWSEMFFVPFPK